MGHLRSVFSVAARSYVLPRCHALRSGMVVADANQQLMRLTTQVSKDERLGPPANEPRFARKKGEPVAAG
jgi:hypothetical protein